jgi:predicted DNA-binding transcriptional regulator YafY
MRIKVPKTENQKLKLFYIAQFLTERTDEEHALTTQEIIALLEQNGIHAERKSIYSDIELLTEFGMDILRVRERSGGYYLASRQFELAELKLLVDAVQSSKFITTKKSRELIKKLESLCSHEQAKQLHRQVVVTNRNKAVNENIYYNVDMIYNAIAANVKVRFQYFEWSVGKEMKLRRDGEFYVVSPWLLTWDDENYYLIAYDDKDGIIKHYRVDKMLKIALTEEQRSGKEQLSDFDIAAYSKKTFGMFAGEEETVTLCCDSSLTGVMIDRFGKEAALRQKDETHILVRVNVAVSRQFFGWVTGLGKAVRIEAPARVADAYRSYMQEILQEYGDASERENLPDLH